MKTSLFTELARDARRMVVVLTICVCGATGVKAIRAVPATPPSPQSSQAQAAEKPKSIQKVDNVSRIRATTADDQNIAAYYDTDGPSLLENEVIIIPAEPEPIQPPPPPGWPSAVNADVDPLRTFVCASAAIVMGEAIESRVILNRSETFLVTDFEVSVSEWLRPNGGSRVIHVTMFGGEVEAGGKTLKATSSPPLDLHAPALLFLKKIPGTSQAYVLDTLPIRLKQGTFVGDDFPQRALQSLRGSPAVNDVLSHLREKHNSCGEQQ
jgi:hypothetical protein